MINGKAFTIVGSLIIGLPFSVIGEEVCNTGTFCLSSNYLEEIVVTGTKTDKSVRESPNAIALISAEEMKWNVTESLAEVLRSVPGVLVTDAGQAGMKRIRIRGEDSYRVAVLVDGQEITDHRGEGVPLTLDPSLVKRVEVIRGAGSVLYGPKALGGVVNFITHKGGEKPLQLTASAGWNSATNAQQKFVSAFGLIEGFDYRFSYGDIDSDNRQTPKGEIENTEYSSRSTNFYLGKRWEGNEVALSWDEHTAYSEVFVEDEVRFAFPFNEFAMRIPQRDRQKAALFYSWDNQGGTLDKVQLNAYRQVSDRKFQTYWSQVFGMEKETFSESELVTEGGLAQLDFQLGDQHLLVAGVQYTKDSVKQDRLELLHMSTPVPMTLSTDIFDQASLETKAVFLQDEWSLSDSVIMTTGMRHYWIDSDLQTSTRVGLITPPKDDQELIAAIALTWDFSESSTVRMSFSEGYMYPSLLQLAIGGVARNFVNPNTSLEPERSDTVDLGWRYSSDRVQFDLTAFVSRAENYIDHVPCVSSTRCIGGTRRSPAEMYVNIAHAKTVGLEAYIEYQLNHSALVYSALTWLDRENEFEDFTTSNAGLPSLNAVAGIKYNGQSFGLNPYWVDVYAKGETSAKETDENHVEHDNAGWVTVNAKAGTEFGAESNYRLVLELNNLFDNSYSTSAENLEAMERNVQAKFIVTF